MVYSNTEVKEDQKAGLRKASSPGFTIQLKLQNEAIQSRISRCLCVESEGKGWDLRMGSKVI